MNWNILGIVIIGIIVLIIIGGLIYVGIKGVDCLKNPIKCLTGATIITDCGKFGNSKPLGDPAGPFCNYPNTELYAGLCYGKCPPGNKRTSFCTCSDLDIQTDANKYGDGRPIGDPLGPNCADPNTELYAGLCYKKCPIGSTRTAACTCQTGSIVTDCGKYGSSKVPDPNCPAGTAYWGGLCYTDLCEKQGGKRTASCTCDFGPYAGIITDCTRFYNKPCPPGYSKTAICTCQKGGIVTNCADYGSSVTPKYTCPSNTDYFEGLCYSGKCPAGMPRTAACTCSNYQGVVTDCKKYGAVGTPTKCPAGRDYYGAECYKGCPADYKRTAVFTCEKGSIKTDCSKYGSTDKMANACPVGSDYDALICYSAPCPGGYKRTAPCSCQKE